MSTQRRHDRRAIRRHGPRRYPKRRLLIVCEGKKTEPEYFKAFQHWARNPLVDVHVAREHGVPLTVVQIAVRLRDQANKEAKALHDDNLRFDEVWGVFDVDEHPNLDQAQMLAKNKNVHLAVSNPCFELWAFLHFKDHRGHIERDRVRAALKRYLPRYDKCLDFEKMHSAYDEAVQRAQRLDQAAERLGAPKRNPSTTVYCLTESIRRESLS